MYHGKREKREVGGYRGRRTITDVLKSIDAILAVLVLLMGAGLLFGQRYIIYTDEGLKLDIPFFRGEEPPPAPSAGSGGMGIVEIPGSQSQPEQPADEPEPVLPQYMRAAELPLSAVLDGTAGERLEQAGADALVLEMKAPSGKLNFVSEEKLAKLAKANPSDPSVNEALKEWNAGDVYTIARVCCFRDDSLPYYCNRVALRTTDGNWRDEGGFRHLDPTDPEAQEYLVGLCAELAQLGFDEILLEYCAYPTRGRLDRILPPDGDPLSPFQGPEYLLVLAADALKDSETILSVRAEKGHITGEAAGSGLPAVALAAYADRIWVDGAEMGASAAELLGENGIMDAENRMVLIGGTQDTDNVFHQAILAEN